MGVFHYSNIYQPILPPFSPQTPCCDGLYRCRFCHDEEENHTLRRDDVSLVECSHCGVRQGVRENCQNCHLKFGQVQERREAMTRYNLWSDPWILRCSPLTFTSQYFCFDCKLYDDEDKQQFHCSGCGICRCYKLHTTRLLNA